MNPGNTTSDPAAQGGDTAAERWQRTAIAAFFRAEARGFAPGHELDDWLAAELEISAAGVAVEAAVADAIEMPTRSGGDSASPPVPPPAKPRIRRAARKPGANPDQPKAVASRKTAVTKRRSTRTRKTPPGVESELGGSA